MAGCFAACEPVCDFRCAGLDVDSIEQVAKLGFGKSEQVEIEILLTQRCKFGAEQLLVPAGVLGNPVVGDDKRAALCFVQVIEHNHRHLAHAETPCGKQASVAGDDHVVGADQHRVDEAKFRDRGGDLRDLIVRMRPRIAGVRDQPVDRPGLDLEVHGLI